MPPNQSSRAKVQAQSGSQLFRFSFLDCPWPWAQGSVTYSIFSTSSSGLPFLATYRAFQLLPPPCSQDCEPGLGAFEALSYLNFTGVLFPYHNPTQMSGNQSLETSFSKYLLNVYFVSALPPAFTICLERQTLHRKRAYWLQ